jgi:GT2 family glycosyltransferase
MTTTEPIGTVETLPSGGGPSIRVQTVLYRPSEGEIERLLRGLRHAAQLLRQQVPGATVVMAFGDCSPNPNLSIEQVSAYSEQMRPLGIDWITYDYFSDNLGSARGHNRLLTEFREDFVLFLNPDAYLSPFALAEMVLLTPDSTAGIIEARQIPLEHPKAFDPDSGDTSWASTAGALVRREVVEAIGGFDAESFFLYCDDVDFSWRARLAGYRVVHQPTAQIFHDKRLTTAAMMEVGEAEHYYAAEAALLLAWKYSRPDLSEKWAVEMEASTMQLQRDAAEEFRKRQADGRLPVPIDPDGKVAQFIGTDFARHRFSYADA